MSDNFCRVCCDDINTNEKYCDDCKVRLAERLRQARIAEKYDLDCFPDLNSRYINDVDEDKTNYGKKSEETWLMDALWLIILKLDEELENAKSKRTS